MGRNVSCRMGVEKPQGLRGGGESAGLGTQLLPLDPLEPEQGPAEGGISNSG